MKLRSLRLAQFRRFNEPVAIDGIGDGVNVLAGPNEMGKSTLFHALEAAFLTRFKTTGERLDAMRPSTGGEPLVEVDFEHAGETLRLRKQFGRGAFASLIPFGRASGGLRDQLAEDRLAEIVSGGRSSPLAASGALGLVWVRQKRSLIDAAPDLDPATGARKERGEYDALMNAVTAEVGNAALGDLFDGVQRRTVTARDALVTSSRGVAKRGGALDRVQTALREAEAAYAEAQTAANAADERRSAIAKAELELARIDNRRETEQTAAALARLDGEIAACIQARAVRDLAREKLRGLRRDLEIAQSAQRTEQERTVSLAAGIKALEQARVIEATIRQRVADTNANLATPAMVQRATALQNQISVADARLQANSATVDIDVTEHGRHHVQIDGQPIVESRSIRVADSLDITIDGLARIRIKQPNAGQAAALRAERETAASELALLLANAGASSLGALAVRADARAGAIFELDNDRLALARLAPRGIEQLADDIRTLQTPSPPVQSPDERDEQSIEALRTALAAAESHFHRAQAAALDDETYRTKVQERERISEQEKSRHARIAQINIELARLLGEQDGSDQGGLAAGRDARAASVERARGEVERVTGDVFALQLLAKTLDDIEADARSTVYEPIVRRMSPHLVTLFGTANLSFKNAFVADRLERAGRAETVENLSDGTREQISVLVRLAFAEVLAVRGEAVPLILDDPLVFSDDQRLAEMLKIIAGATTVPQTLIFTCREAAFEALPGRRLTIQKWRAD